MVLLKMEEENKTVEQLKKEIRIAEILDRVKKEEEKWKK